MGTEEGSIGINTKDIIYIKLTGDWKYQLHLTVLPAIMNDEGN